uniref:T-cell surface protein tactile isoform X3 n=1 Tax=Myodes glareolus TaxID=447135 RepID=UPI0020213AC1|nr:T-cell surface protein tactile isoform X3 [Myodes glareolus]
MGRKWTYCAVYSIIQIQFFRGIWEERVNAGETIYSPPGSDVNLTCQTTKEKEFLVQAQWSKVTDKNDLLVVYHPQYSFHCPQSYACEAQVASIKTQSNVTEWTLFLRNISTTFSGKYECSFTVYPEGIQTTVYNLVVAPLAQEEHNYTIETETNLTLEIPCFQNTSSEISPGLTFSWLVEKDGVQEVLLTHDNHICNSASFQGRVKLGADSGLHLSPVQIQDDGLIFSCHLRVSPLEVWKTSTTIKVFAKPEILMVMENGTKDVLGERVFTCLLKKVFPKTNITWLIDGRFLQGNEEGIYVTNDKKTDRGGFWEVKSVLRRIHGNRPVQSNNVTVQCMALSPGPRNKMWNISSQAILLPLDSVNVPTENLASVTGSTMGTQPFPNDNVSPTTSRAASSSSASWPSPSVSPPEWLSSPGTSTKPLQPDAPADALIPSEMHTSVPSEASLAPHDVVSSTTKEFPDVATTARGMTKNDHNYITSITVNKPRDGMSWPVVVAALLFFCTILFVLGVRKWCQYQKEIMERPPPFKPPPPPIKYTCIQEPTGYDLPSHEMETL